MSDELKPQSVDTLDFRDLLWDVVRTGGNERVIRDVIAHIALAACGNDQATVHDAELCWSAMIEAAPAPVKNQTEGK